MTTNTSGLSRVKIAACTALSAMFRHGAFLSLLVCLLIGSAEQTNANVIQANQTYPPPNGSFRSPGPDYNFGTGASAVQLKDMAFTFFDNFVLVPTGPVTTVSFTAQCSHRISTDGGTTFSGEQAATATFVVTLTGPTGNDYAFQITSLTISGGDLPATFQLRIPVSGVIGTPVATFTPNTPSPGLFSIDTTFYLPLELSQDSGSTWTPNTISGAYGTPAFSLSPLSSEEVSHSPTLPPGDGTYYTPDTYHAAFASGIIIRNPIHNGFLGQSCTDSNTSGQPGLTNVLCPPPILGGTQTEDFTSQMQFDLELPALVNVGPITASVQTRITHTQDSGVLQIFDAQMLQLNPNPGSLPAGMNFRLNPDPNKPSRGITTMRIAGTGLNDTNISSAFALRLQMTTDNGATWQDADQFTRMVLRISPGTGFPTSPANEQTFSIGVFQIVVDPSFAFLFAPSNSTSYYPGYAGPASGILTSPVMYDGSTKIGESVSHVRPATTFPVAVGTPAAYPANTTYSNIFGYSDYALIPSPFAGAPTGLDEMFTQIQELNLQGYASDSHSNGVACSDPRVPSVRSQTMGQLVTVKAGPGTFGIGPTLPMNRRSIGIVQQNIMGTDDFPARSFFDIFVDVNLPGVPGTVSVYEFPAGGAVLYNDAANPLLIENLSITNLPPEATYVHGQTTAVPVRFKYSNPPFWAADDVLGYLTLAGHGVFTNVITASVPCAVAITTGGLLDQTLGPVGSPMAAPPVPWLRPTNSFPTPNAALASVVNRPVDSGVTNILDDQVSFNLPGLGTIVVRDVSLPSFLNSIPLPDPLASSTYQSPVNTLLDCEISIQDGISDPGFYPVAGGSPASIMMVISNTASGSPAVFDTEFMEMTWFGNIFGGDFGGLSIGLRESPSKASLGKHTVSSDPRGYRVASFFDIFLEVSFDGGVSWTPANKAIRLQPSLPPAVPQSLFVTRVFKQGPTTRMVLDWQNSFNLQSAPTVLGPWSDMGQVVSGPFTNIITGTQRYFRLRQ